MGCGCNKKKNWVYVDAEGREHPQRTEIEARALYIRAGRVGDVRQVNVPLDGLPVA